MDITIDLGKMLISCDVSWSVTLSSVLGTGHDQQYCTGTVLQIIPGKCIVLICSPACFKNKWEKFRCTGKVYYHTATVQCATINRDFVFGFWYLVPYQVPVPIGTVPI